MPTLFNLPEHFHRSFSEAGFPLSLDINETIVIGFNCNGDQPSETPLHWAIYKSTFESVKALLDLGADPNQNGCFSYKPLRAALEKKDANVFNLLLSHPKIDVNHVQDVNDDWNIWDTETNVLGRAIEIYEKPDSLFNKEKIILNFIVPLLKHPSVDIKNLPKSIAWSLRLLNLEKIVFSEFLKIKSATLNEAIVHPFIGQFKNSLKLDLPKEILEEIPENLQDTFGKALLIRYNEVFLSMIVLKQEKNHKKQLPSSLLTYIFTYLGPAQQKMEDKLNYELIILAEKEASKAVTTQSKLDKSQSVPHINDNESSKNNYSLFESCSHNIRKCDIL